MKTGIIAPEPKVAADALDPTQTALAVEFYNRARRTLVSFGWTQKPDDPWWWRHPDKPGDWAMDCAYRWGSLSRSPMISLESEVRYLCAGRGVTTAIFYREGSHRINFTFRRGDSSYWTIGATVEPLKDEDPASTEHRILTEAALQLDQKLAEIEAKGN